MFQDYRSKLHDSSTFSWKFWAMAAGLSCFLPTYIIVKSRESVFNASMPTPVQKEDCTGPQEQMLSVFKNVHYQRSQSHNSESVGKRIPNSH